MATVVVAGFELSQQIGEGAFSKVYLGIRKDRKSHALRMQAAIKVIAVPTDTNAADYKKKVIKEVRLHKAASHINILKLLDWAEQKDGSIFIVLEYAQGGDLFDKISPDVGISEELAHLYFTQLLAALNFCHASGIVHRDVKPENMLLDHEGNLKLADFGLADLFKYQGKEKRCTEACGSAPYAAPELALGVPYRAQPIDIWSAGVVLFTLLVGNTPWDQPTSASEEYSMYLSGEIFQHDPWSRLPEELLSLLTSVLHPEPKQRAKLTDIAVLPWFQIANPYLKNGLVTNSTGLWDALYSAMNAQGEFAVKSVWSDDSSDKSAISAGSQDVPLSQRFQGSQGMYSQQSRHRQSQHSQRYDYSGSAPSNSMPRSQGRVRQVFADITNRGQDADYDAMRKERNKDRRDQNVDAATKANTLHQTVIEASMRAATAGGHMGTASQYSQCLSMAPSQLANPNNARFWSDKTLEEIASAIYDALQHLGIKCEAFQTSDGAEIAWATRDRRGEAMTGSFKIKYEPTSEDYEHTSPDSTLAEMVRDAHEARAAAEAEEKARRSAAAQDDDTIQFVSVQNATGAGPARPRVGRGNGGYSVSLQGQGDPLERKRVMFEVEKLLPQGIVRAR